MAKNGIKDLRDMLMETIERLIDPDDPMDAKTAQAIASVGNVVVGTAKVQLQMARLSKGQSPVGDFRPDNPKQIANFAQASLCIQHAANHGHPKETAESCENYSVNCPDCPFK